MIFTKRGALAFTLAAAIAAGAQAAPLTRTIEYDSNAQPTIYCAAAMLCEIRLAFGERVTRAWNGQAQLWSPDGGVVNGRPIITLKPEAPGFKTNFVILTTQREYRIMLVSYDGTKQTAPLYTQFVYNAEARHRIAIAPKPAPTARPLTIAEQMDRACAKMPADELYGIDAQPANLHPEGLASRNRRSVCHTLTATYIQMPLGGPEPTNIPTVVEDAPDGVRIVNAPYDPTSRIFHVDDVAAEYSLISGKARLRIERQIAGVAISKAK
jgi:hypothetical protein